MKVLILEDESRTALHLGNLLLTYDATIKIVAVLPSVDQAAKWLGTNPAPDLILMDIHLEDELVFGLFTKIKIQVPVIFTTAYDAYMLQAFKVSGIDYLLKPVQYVDLAAALNKFRSLREHFATANYQQLISLVQQVPSTTYRERFMITMGNRMHSVETIDIAYVLLISKITYIITQTNKRYIISYSLDELAGMLDPKKFFRVNRQCIAGLTAIVHAHQLKPGHVRLELKPAATDEVFVSGDRLADFKEWFGK